MSAKTFEEQGVRVAVEGCGHGTLNAIYAAVDESCKSRGWDGVDVLIIGGDFQAVRNSADLTVMSVPAKYREMADFWEYYAGRRTAPYLTIFIAGNHEAASHLWELYYGGWVAPNIYYMGAANVLRLGPLRIAGLSGIWKGFDYRKTHHERLPFGPDDVKSFYHVREFDVRKLLLLRSQVDIGLSHDWPRAIEKWGDQKSLWRMKPDFERESNDGTLGNVAAEYLMDRLRPPYWFSAHLHCKYAALKTYDDNNNGVHDLQATAVDPVSKNVARPSMPPPASVDAANPDEIDLDDDGMDVDTRTPAPGSSESETKPDEISGPQSETEKKSDEKKGDEKKGDDGGGGGVTENTVSEELRAQLPASFARPASTPKTTPGQPVPPGITNKQVRFLALDKCLPSRRFLQLLEIHPYQTPSSSASSSAPPVSEPSLNAANEETTEHHRQPHQHPGRYALQYDPEWLAITRVFHPYLKIGDRTAHPPQDLGEAVYAPSIDTERAWVEEHVMRPGRLDVPANFTVTAPPHVEAQDWRNPPDQPFEYTNPQTAALCELLGLENLWDASDEERMARKASGPPASSTYQGGYNRGGAGGRGGRGFGGRRGRGGGRGRGRGRGGRGRFH
ncbi:hypothetical protein SODALDRAFT_342463 [Sodiomyces alkalinus F11]|uniref:Lariat debranching enzyme C-terminal domain-containing protein n=1 Tax=Sodiomyces alkalinus (strain CBS 110278 / VKM F-3762 / F11) TaxID=1314773 RepID=A0A3N2Q9L3_SODAK|nr:hypothetical protein SODALDRAFT_342463 [Sodiomyces alkalinus F11]ROT43453.1 hypothetical protein SODALDRAFT_342463 [Sodiomyces alkalinus F11]